MDEKIERVNKRKLADFILGLCDMGIDAELSREEHLSYIEDALGKTTETLVEYLALGAMEQEGKKSLSYVVPSMPDMEDETESEIARFILAIQPMGSLLDYDDEFHYVRLGKALSNTPEMLLYYLGDAAENNKIPKEEKR